MYFLQKHKTRICYNRILLTTDFWKYNQNYFGNMQSCENMYNRENYCGIMYFNAKLLVANKGYEDISQ